MAANYAKFKITGSVGGLSASSAAVFRAVPGEVLTLELETPTPVNSVLYELNGTGADDQPLASYNAYALTLAGGVFSKTVSPGSGSTTITMPTTELDTHSWVLRATASTDEGAHVFERKLVYSMGKPDKNIPGETTQGGARGWGDGLADLIGSALPYIDIAASTGDNAAHNIGNGWMPPRSSNIVLRGRVTAQQNSVGGNFKEWEFSGVWRTDTASPAAITVITAAAFTLVRDLSGGAFLPGGPAISIASNKLFPTVTGVAGQTVKWHFYWEASLATF